MPKTNKTVVRNSSCRRDSLNVRERHNERKNESYFNADIIPERAELNYHFQKCEGTYEQNFDNLIAAGAISTRGLKTDAKIVDEFIFDVNTEYFERNGGYDYAKKFYEEAYKLAVKEVGNEDYILSAVMHADEKNTALSQELGRDVFHYHLHVVYIPVVDKEVYFKKNNKNPELAGKLKEVIHQVSHSKKWPRQIQLDENSEPMKSKTGKTVLINSYSLLQDRFYDHMKEAGYDGFERGDYKSTAKHLSDLDYKIQQDTARIEEIAAVIMNKTNTIAELNEETEKKKKQLDDLNKKTAVLKEHEATFADIDRMGEKKTFKGDIAVSPKDWKKVSGLAKEGIKAQGIIATLKEKISSLLKKIFGLEKRLEKFEGGGIIDTMDYYEARQRAPKRMAETIADIKRNPPEQNKQQHQNIKTKSREETI